VHHHADRRLGTGAYCDYAEVRPNLYLGARPESSRAVLGLFGAVVDLRADPGNGPAFVYGEARIPYRHLPMIDGVVPPRWQEHLDPLVVWIGDRLREDRRVLVHCDAGVSRSAFVLAYYLVRTERMLLDDALRELRQRRSSVNPHLVFREALREAAAGPPVCEHDTGAEPRPGPAHWSGARIRDNGASPA
jgi:hypothetical protein